MTAITPKILFENGKYSELVRLFDNQTFDPSKIEQLSYVVIGLLRKGRIEEAYATWKSHGVGLKKKQLVKETLAVYFYFVIESTRSPSLINYQKVFLSKLLDVRHDSNSSADIKLTARFYIIQAMAFIKFFSQSYYHSERLALKALEYGLHLKNFYFAYLSFDLAGHSAINAGYLERGLAHLTRALEYTKKAKRNREINACQINITLYESAFGSDISNILEKLSLCLSKHCEDNYTFASINLELVYQYVVRGKFKEAHRYLYDAEQYIKSSGNKNLEIELVLYRTLTLLLEGSLHQAAQHFYQHFVENGALLDKKNKKVVMIYHCLICFPELQWVRLKSEMIEFPSLDKSNHYLDHVLFNCLNQTPSSIETISKFEFFGCLRLFFRMKSSNIFFLPYLTSKSIVVVAPQGVHIINGKFNKVQYALLTLCQDFQVIDKNTIIEKIWNYQYNPNRHNKLIYPMISRFRKQLGPSLSKHFLSEAEAYRFRYPVKIVDLISQVSNNVVNEGYGEKRQVTRSLLNHRQHELLCKLNQHDWIDSKSYQQLHAVSRATATRDLSELYHQGLLECYGKGGGIKYKKSGGD